MSLALPPDDEASAFVVRAMSGRAAMIEGDTHTGLRQLQETVAAGDTATEPVHALWASWAALWVADDPAFGRLLKRAISLARPRGELGTLADALGTYAVHSAIEQRLDDALVAAREGVDLAQSLGATNLELLPRTALAIVAAQHGDEETTREQAQWAIDIASAHGSALRAVVARYALALLDIGLGRWVDAAGEDRGRGARRQNRDR
jgi:hypothetical protein